MAEMTRWDDMTVWETSGFLRFLQEHHIQVNDLLDSSCHEEARRFFRLKQSVAKEGNVNYGRDTRLQSIAAHFVARETADSDSEATQRVTPQAVNWLPGFYSLPMSLPLARVGLYQDGQVYGIDVSSGYAVSLLNIQPGEHVLDLCLYKYKLFREEEDVADVTWRCRLFHADGRVFNIGPKTECNGFAGLQVLLDTHEIASRAPKDRKRKRKNKSARARDAKRQHVLEIDPALYDKVLVDAECTHDGSIRHLQRLNTAAKWDEYVHDHLNPSEVDRILTLQHDLIRNGFNLLRPGGFSPMKRALSLTRLREAKIYPVKYVQKFGHERYGPLI
uniref:Uncharacterized protein n=1 Tax=Peronospora matthiolae TaxID=2874970 RepID=A0AAV1TSC3_9STRA